MGQYLYPLKRRTSIESTQRRTDDRRWYHIRSPMISIVVFFIVDRGLRIRSHHGRWERERRREYDAYRSIVRRQLVERRRKRDVRCRGLVSFERKSKKRRRRRKNVLFPLLCSIARFVFSWSDVYWLIVNVCWVCLNTSKGKIFPSTCPRSKRVRDVFVVLIFSEDHHHHRRRRFSFLSRGI